MIERMSLEEYAEFLRFDSESTIPGEFIKDKDGTIWFSSGGSECVGCAFCNWHSGMDAVYAVGSSTIANVGIDSETLQQAVDILCSLDGNEEIPDQDHIERKWLIELSLAALDADPSEEMQTVYS